MPTFEYQSQSSFSSYAPPIEEEGIGASDIFSMCSLICFIPWSSFMVISDTSGDDSQGSTEQGFQKSETTDCQCDDISEISDTNSMTMATAYQPIPSWKEKYIARKAVQGTSKDCQEQSHTYNSSPSKRTSLEETLNRCRNICNSMEQEEEESSSHSSWASYFGFSTGSTSSIYSMLKGSLDTDSLSNSTSDERSCDLNIGRKVHRRHNSPSGIMDLVD